MITKQGFSSARVQPQVQVAAAVRKMTHEEAHALAQAEFARLLAVVESLSGGDWAQPTYCTLWNVRDLVAHLAGGTATFSSWGEFRRHYITNPHAKEWEKPEDACNYLQVKERAGRTPAEVVREFRETGPKELRFRYDLPWLVRMLPLPTLPPITLGYLTDTVLTRDWLGHRLDLCHATGQELVLTSEHEGRLTALVIRDVAKKVKRRLTGRTVELVLTGPAGGRYRFGKGSVPDATIEMDAMDFHLRASERIGVEEAHERAAIQGDEQIARWFLENCAVLY